MKIWKNPIYNKELRIGSRSFKMPLALMIYNFLLAVITLFVLAIAQFSYRTGSYDYNGLITLFPVLASVQCFIIVLIVPILTAASVSGERERQTLDVMLTTPIRPVEIAKGKLVTALTQVMMFVISSVPIMSIAFIIGGMNWINLLCFVVGIIYLSIYVGSIGIFCSSAVKRTIASVILSFVILVGIQILSGVLFVAILGIPTLIKYLYFEAAGINLINFSAVSSVEGIALLFNPITTFIDFVVRSATASSLYEGMETWYDGMGAHMLLIQKVIYMFWIPISMAVNIGVSYLFLLGAAKKINPVRKRR